MKWKNKSGFYLSFLSVSGCSRSMCSARGSSNEQRRNRNGSHIHINILQTFSCYSGSCGRMLDNVTEMSAATTSTVLTDYVLPLQRPFTYSDYRWEEYAYFHFNSIQILTSITSQSKDMKGANINHTLYTLLFVQNIWSINRL